MVLLLFSQNGEQHRRKLQQVYAERQVNIPCFIQSIGFSVCADRTSWATSGISARYRARENNGVHRKKNKDNGKNNLSKTPGKIHIGVIGNGSPEAQLDLVYELDKESHWTPCITWMAESIKTPSFTFVVWSMISKDMLRIFAIANFLTLLFCITSSLGKKEQLLTEQQFLDYHNQYRKMLLDGSLKNQPRAANMPSLISNKRLTRDARNWAKKCVFKHDASSKDGENLAASSNVADNLFGQTQHSWDAINTSATLWKMKKEANLDQCTSRSVDILHACTTHLRGKEKNPVAQVVSVAVRFLAEPNSSSVNGSSKNQNSDYYVVIEDKVTVLIVEIEPAALFAT
ncbi:hypothetical protein CLF_100678 [Clonorchis sinensis]|uniref:SCP domain-containing protein n=1 Tax=Clonorchis sinensis TaxID=79923 RepID=G7Y402_CLOSI|nr:hypothetical protein CLF_100678 [Clonorchis sinensis]